MKNIMESINWVVGFTQLLLMVGVIAGPSLWINIVSFLAMVVMMGLYFGIYIHWMIHDPNRLQ